MTKPIIYFDRHLAAINNAVSSYFAHNEQFTLEIENRAGYWAPLKETIKWYISFIKRLKNKEFTLVHANRAKIALLCTFYKVPFIYSIHGIPNIIQEMKEGFKEFLLCLTEIICMKLAYKNALLITGISEYVCKETEKHYGFLPKVMYNGYNNPMQNTENYSKCENNFISVGRLDPIKNPLRVLLIFKKILEKNPNAKLVYLGRGSMEKVFRQKIIEYDLKNSVIYEGFVPHETIAKYYYKAGYFISACDLEGFGLAALEAFSYGCKPLLPYAGAFPEIFTDKTFFYDKDFTVDLSPINSETRVAILERFTWQKTLSIWNEIYADYLKKL